MLCVSSYITIEMAHAFQGIGKLIWHNFFFYIPHTFEYALKEISGLF